MCRRGEGRQGLRAAAVALLVVLAGPRSGHGQGTDEVAAYLEGAGLVELLAVHFEMRLETAPPNARDDLVVRLADLYAQLLETMDDPGRRRDLAERSRRLLTEAPPGSGNELRLALLRATYRQAEKTAESHRLRDATPEETAQARATFDELVPELARLRRMTEDAAESADRRRGRAAGTEAILLAEEAEKARLLDAQGRFLSAWALYYQAWLGESREPARAAERLFIGLLDFGDEPPLPENVTVDLRSTEAIARCILGMALSKSITAATPTSLAWVTLLEHERTFEPIRKEAPAWRMVVLLEHGEFVMVRAELDRRAALGEETPLPWLRLVAVHALEAGARSRYAAELARYAVTELAARGELAQVFDLADRYGVDALGASGFAMRYIGGVLEYYEAREAHAGDDPTVDPEVAAGYGRAVTELRAALSEPDAASYAASRPDCLRLVAWSLYFRGELLEARAGFERAAAELPADAAPEALWMAIVRLDRLVEADGRSSALDDELARLVGRFLAEYPSSEHAPKLLLRRALTTGEVSPELADALLAIPANSEVHETARRRAAQILYRLFRDSVGGRRIGYGQRYLAVALPLHERDEETLDLSEDLAWQRYVVRARRILEVSLRDGIGRLDAARAVLASLDQLAPEGASRTAALGAIEPELRYRRLQERLLAGDPATAAALAEALAEADPDDVWARLAVRSMFRFSSRTWREAEEASEDERSSVALILRFGPRVLAEYGDGPAALENRSVMAYAVTVAEASMHVWERSGDPARGAAALALYERLLAVRPRNASFLRAVALLSEAFDDPVTAIECWRTLVAGSGRGSAPWYEAKLRLLRLLAGSDPARALAVMAQHRQLDPEYGPEPWGPQLQALDVRLRAEHGDADAPSPPAPSEDAGGSS